MSNYIIFSANYIPHLGGVERYAYNMAKEMALSGNRVTVVTSDVSCNTAYEVDGNIEIFRLPSYRVMGERFPVLKINRKLFHILKEIFSRKFDYGIVNTRFYILSLVASIALKRNRVPFVVIEHGTNHFTVNNRALDFFGHIYEHAITSIIKRNTKEFAGVSIACTKWLQHFNIFSSTVFYNAIDIESIRSLQSSSDKQFRSAFNIPEDAKIVAYSGRLVKEKGIEKLIDAINYLNESGHKIYLVIAGDGDLLKQIEAIDRQEIISIGKVDFYKIVDLLNEADIFCLPTDYPEGLPTSVLEAAACKTYIVTTNAGGSSELIIDSSYGCILEKNTAPAIARAIQMALEDNELRKNCVEKAYDKVINEFEWSKVTQKVIDHTRTKRA
jgi:glycosyltransferase involved in cell wall biosynthesis